MSVRNAFGLMLHGDNWRSGLQSMAARASRTSTLRASTSRASTTRSSTTRSSTSKTKPGASKTGASKTKSKYPVQSKNRTKESRDAETQRKRARKISADKLADDARIAAIAHTALADRAVALERELNGVRARVAELEALVQQRDRDLIEAAEATETSTATNTRLMAMVRRYQTTAVQTACGGSV